MNCKNKIGILIFSFGVLLFLLRPCIVYQLLTADTCKTNPSYVLSLLQRVIKKKEGHHEQQAEAVSIMTITQKSVAYSAHFFPNSNNQILTNYDVSWHREGLYNCFQPGAP